MAKRKTVRKKAKQKAAKPARVRKKAKRATQAKKQVAGKKAAKKKRKVAKRKGTQKKSSKARAAVKKKKKAVRRITARTVKKKRIPKNSDNFQLHLLFKTDKPCRDCFEFLRVSTLEELQQFNPRQIVDFLSVPFMQSVERMRARLAEVGTCLAGDEAFLARYQEQQKKRR